MWNTCSFSLVMFMKYLLNNHQREYKAEGFCVGDVSSSGVNGRADCWVQLEQACQKIPFETSLYKVFVP